MATLFRSHVFSMLLAALVFGAAIPCEVLEAAGIPVCLEETSECSTESEAGEEGACCAVCLACCAVSLKPADPTALSMVASAPVHTPEWHRLMSASHIPVWHPPRA